MDFNVSLLADNIYLFPVSECVEGGVYGPNPMQRVSKAAKKLPESTLLPGGTNPRLYLNRILSSGE